MFKRSIAAVLAACLTIGAFAPATAFAADAPAKDAKAAHADEGMDLPPFPADRTVQQSVEVGGRTLRYEATVGSLPVRDEKGKVIADVMYVAYVVPGRDRPVTFALNGGPGASSVYLNLGAIGPKHVQFGAEGDSPSDPATLRDNPGTWLDFTDLVFIDPVGTGFSRARVPEDEAKKQFYATDADIHYLSRIIYDWLVKNGRMTSRKYLVGESYGGFRGPRITHYLQTRLGVAMNGLVLVSPYLDPGASDDGDLSPLPWMLTLPSIAAANLERQGRLTDAAMAKVIDYTRGDYVTDLLKGRSDPQALERIVKRVTELSGLDPTFVRRSGGRLETQAYLREVYRAEGKLGSRYDSNVTAWDPFPFDPQQRTNDPLLDSIVAPTTTAMVDFITRTVGWKYDGRYNALSYEVNRMWDRKGSERGSVQELRQAVAIDPKLQVLIAHGWGDLSCPFMASVLIVDQMPVMGDADRVQVKEYPGGHMFYSRGASQAALRRDVMALYQRH
ncbi:peptidase S10 serine carboxypeptidase [Mizugakiibacter sediminis]|uniref:Peptidase S10 n=1 Tax=Mizugakiibacter sediminis TaxID=1475481 RepID=A0A0K8QRI3_9GAMM|nr:peptidase S10 [Mizugakiibacter sediminis]GAP67549.1 peptidase S10 serine carboxypeptidase [Mizugakiibacter sediminis]